ncbi:eCIS core domain-containing protein [Nostoc sp.]|uniref:eCIS core domain-containing protein n=1 Tax=Nostoc sp. TaxID=1180 RepID=UPI002FF9D249
MRERVSQPKKATTASFSIPALKQPTRGFGLDSPGTSSQAVPSVQPFNKPLMHDISRISLRSQTKLTVNQPGDVYEQEADRVAQQVMQTMSESVSKQSVQREALPEEEEELQMKSLADNNVSLQREALPEEEEELQMKSVADTNISLQCQGGGIAATSDLETSIQQERGGGQTLSDDIRQPMEQAFGTDFSGVKIHTDSRSDQLNQSIQARAFTTGQDIFFRQGEYAPESNGGKELLAHELTHVVQQNGSALGRKLLPDQEIKKNKSNLKPF